MFSLFAKKNVLAVNQREVVTSGSVNVYEVQFQFDNSWDGLEKTAVFRVGEETVSTLLDETGICVIPWEVLQDAKRTLYAGVYGTKDGNIVLPTIWASLGEIKQGVNPGESTQPPTPDVYSQILQVAKDAEDVAQSVRDDADSGKFNGEQGPTGPQGYTYTPAVSEEGVISWTNDGSLPNPSPVNITGPQGETGETPDITAGTVETLEPGQDATAEITGETPNLVLNLGIPKGQPGQDAPQIDDDVVSATNPWSSRQIVDTLAPEFEASGPVVTCNPVAGYPLHVVSQIMPVQEGEGDPSPENVRPISGWDSATLTHNDTIITIQLGQTVYGGTLDWTTGVLTVTWVGYEFTGDSSEGWVYDSNGFLTDLKRTILKPFSTSSDIGLCNLFQYRTNYAIGNWLFVESSARIFVSKGILNGEFGVDVNAWTAWLSQQASAGTPLQIVYQIAEPITIQLTPTEILALSGTNTLYTDTGDTVVSGREDPNAVIQRLSERIAALEEQAING